MVVRPNSKQGLETFISDPGPESSGQRRTSIPTILVTPPVDRFHGQTPFQGVGRRHSSHTCETSANELSEFALPGVEEEDLDGKEFRPRTGSAGIKSLIKFRSRNKSGDNKNSATSAQDTDEKQKGLKGFLDSLRPRSKSDASNLKHTAMMRKKHPSAGSTSVAAGNAAVAGDAGNNTAQIQQTLNDNQRAYLDSTMDLEPLQRPRATSLGAKDKLRMMRIEKERRVSGAVPNNVEKTTIMGKLMSNGIQQSQSLTGNDQQEHQYTGQALIWERNDDEEAHTADSSYLDRMQIEDIELNDPLVFNKFMRAHKCYDIIPTSSKLIVFDTSLSVKKAFYALVYNGVRAAPLWDHKKQDFVGMLTISDFIFILHKYYRSPQEKMKELEEHQISSWRKELSQKYQPFVSISPEASVLEAVRRLSAYKVHRLPVIDPISGNAVYIITHKRILKFVHLFMKNVPKPAFMNLSIEALHLGTYQDVAAVHTESKIIEALKLFVSRRVSALPVLDDEEKVVNIYAKFDVINLAAEKSYNNLDVPISQAISYRSSKGENVVSCRRTDTLSAVIDKVVKSGVHRLIITDSEGRLDGVISLSDILHFIIQEDATVKAAVSSSSCLKAANGSPAAQWANNGVPAV